MKRDFLEIKSIEDFEKCVKHFAKLEALREKNVPWEKIAKKFKLGSETSARRFYNKLKNVVENPPEGLEHIDFTREALQKTVKAKKINGQRYLISSITPGATTNQKAFLSLYKKSKELNAKVILLLARSHNRPLEAQIYHYDSWLKQFKDVLLVTEYVFNKNIMAVDLQINPQQLNPLTGIKGINWGEDSASVIVATTQLCLEAVARGNGRTPRIIAGTGTISNPNYLKDTRTGRMAEQNHDCGAFIVEVVNNSKFFIRPLEIDPKTGNFYDVARGICKKYTPEGSTKANAKGWVLGDKHIGHPNPKVWEAQKELANITKPEEYALHDVLDGNSASHHTWKKPLKRFQRPFFSIQEELDACKKFLEDMAKLLPKAQGYMIDSNHHDHITKYLEDGNYLFDKINYAIGHRMIVELLDGINPLSSRLDVDNKLIWTTHKDDYYIEGVNIAIHGHRGPNGSKGSLKSIANIEKSAIIGHSHTPGMYRGIMQVGHSSAEEHGYNEGPSSWITADGLIYEGGLKQLIMYIDGEFYLKD